MRGALHDRNKEQQVDFGVFEKVPAFPNMPTQSTHVVDVRAHSVKEPRDHHAKAPGFGSKRL